MNNAKTTMNDPHVTALHFWVTHDDSVDYEHAEELEFANDLFQVKVNGRQATVSPNHHYASEDEAKAAIEPFVRHWEFESRLEAGSGCFSLTYLGADVVDRNPPPPPPGVVQISATIRSGPPTVRINVRVGKATYPTPPLGKTLNLDSEAVQKMLYQLDMYHKQRALLAGMAYFSVTNLIDSVPGSVEGKNADQKATNYYGISRSVLRKVRDLSSNKGGSEARKVGGTEEDFTSEEKAFLVAAVRAFIRRAAEKSTYPSCNWPRITLADLPKVHG